MNVLLVYAHPEPTSLNGSLRDTICAELARLGHAVQVSDLYAMKWKAVLDGDDFPQRADPARIDVIAESRQAYTDGTQGADVRAEQDKLLWADVLLVQFPFWWFSMPAILKGWFERVYANGFAYGVGEHSRRRWGERYGEGMFKGKRAMLIVTAGGWAPHYEARGINGPIDDLLFPIQHGTLFYPGYDVLAPQVIYHAGGMTPERYAQETAALKLRLASLAEEPVLAYRTQNGGDYEIPSLKLKPGLGTGQLGFALHLATDASTTTTTATGETP